MSKIINVETEMVFAENAGEYIPNKDCPEPDYLKFCRMSDEELLSDLSEILGEDIWTN